MKMTYWRTLVISLGLAAPVAWADDQLPASTPGKDAPAPATAKPTPRPARPAAAPAVSADPISGPGPAIVRQNNVNVRGKAAINSEVVARLTRGERVNVLEEVTLKKAKQDEPAKWAKIALPTNATVWAHSSFIDPANQTVIPKRLNLRTGPSENHSIIGRIERGAKVQAIDRKGDWIQVEPPPDAYGFVAAHLLSKDAPPAIAAATPNTPPPIETAVPANPTPPPAGDPAPAPAITSTTPADPATAPAPATPDPAPAPAPEPEEDPFVKRVVTREGIVERSVSIQAPSHFILQALDTRRAINYLFSPATNVMLKDFRGQRIIVTGEELLDERWPNTPVIQVEKIETVP